MNEAVKVQKETSFNDRNNAIKFIQKLLVTIVIKYMWVLASHAMTFEAREGARYFIIHTGASLVCSTIFFATTINVVY